MTDLNHKRITNMANEITEEMYAQAREVARQRVVAQLDQIRHDAHEIAREVVRQLHDELWEQEMYAALVADPSNPEEAFEVAYELAFEDAHDEAYGDALAELYDEAIRMHTKMVLQKQLRKTSQGPH
jgi:hypothetical protein